MGVLFLREYSRRMHAGIFMLFSVLSILKIIKKGAQGLLELILNSDKPFIHISFMKTVRLLNGAFSPPILSVSPIFSF
jgi:uncharacterized membrane protein YkgB